MTLLDACEPLFQHICALNRLGRSGGATADLATLRREITLIIDSVRRSFLSDQNLERHWPKLEMPVLFFVDSMISESNLPVAAEWNQHRLAYDYKELAGDEKFYEILKENLKDTSSDATARLGFYYTCLGVGFTGYFPGNPAQLRSLMLDIVRRIDPTVRTDEHLRIDPEAYENVDTRDLIEPVPIRGGVLLAFVLALSAIFVFVNIFLFEEATLRLREDLRSIQNQASKLSESHLKISL